MQIIRSFFSGLGVILLLLVVPTGAWANVIHVKADATGANNGTSWNDAYTTLTVALTAALAGNEIWVAEGTYKPTSGVDRSQSFEMTDGVAIYGGFAGGETAREERDWVAHPTILSGDIGTPGDSSDNSCTVVEGNDNAVLDGFTVTGGNNGDNYGGGMYNLSDSVTVTNCTFKGNSAHYGGGMYNNLTPPTVTNCTFSSNSATKGGGMFNFNTSPTVTNCTFSSNSATNSGGGMYNDNMSWYSHGSPTVINCTFSNNSATYGGGMLN